jgi:hypothetical protein
MFPEICCLVSVGRPLWWEGGAAICSVIIQWSESRRTRNQTLLSHLGLPQPGGPGEVGWGYFTDGRSISMSWYGAPVCYLRPNITSCRNLAVWNSICSVITQWSESRRTRNRTLLSHLRLPPTSRARWGGVKLLYWRSVSQYVLVSSTRVLFATRYYFLSECCCLKFPVLFLWGALSD